MMIAVHMIMNMTIHIQTNEKNDGKPRRIRLYQVRLVFVHFLLHLDPNLDWPARLTGRFRRSDVRRKVLQLAISNRNRNANNVSNVNSPRAVAVYAAHPLPRPWCSESDQRDYHS